VNVDVPVVVGVPEITPVDALKVSPAGSDPLTMLVVSGAVPPAETIVVLYATPTIPSGGTPLRVGSGFTVILTVSWFFVFGIAATRVSCMGAVIPDGAVYVTAAPVVAERVPQAAPLQLVPENVHATVKLPESVAVILTDCPASRTTEEAERLVMPPPGYPPPPHPESMRQVVIAKSSKAARAREMRLRMLRKSSLSCRSEVVSAVAKDKTVRENTIWNLASNNCFQASGPTFGLT
jgi:hypothetical protein